MSKINEELDSQLSAMFDDELPPAECELLARRLSRDEALKARWGRYAVMAAVIRAERGVRLNAPLAGRVSAVLVAEPELNAPAPHALGRRVYWWQPLAASAGAAAVAAVAILWLRAQSPEARAPAGPALASGTSTAALVVAAPPRAAFAADSRNGSYIVPPAPAMHTTVVPSTELANYVVAHSMFSSPVARRNLLSAFITSEAGVAGAEEAQDDVKSAAQ